jgi:hypothetical protein
MRDESADDNQELGPASRAWARYYAAAEEEAAARAKERARHAKAAGQLTHVIVVVLAIAVAISYVLVRR